MKNQQAYVLFYQQKSIQNRENFNQFCQELSKKEVAIQISKKRPLESVPVQKSNNEKETVVEVNDEEPKKKKKKVKAENETKKEGTCYFLCIIRS